MDTGAITELLAAIRDAVSSQAPSPAKDDDVALPLFDPEKNDCGAASWCSSIEILATEFKWSSIKTAAKAGKALKGSALTWFETWEPLEARNWENFRRDIIDIYPEKRNLSEKLAKAVFYSSDSAESYSEYVREKIRLFRNTKIILSDEQLIEIICGGIDDVDVRMASLNNGATTPSALITLLSTYVKKRKRTLEQSEIAGALKRPKPNIEKKCFICNQVGHVQSQCLKIKSNQNVSRYPNQVAKINDFQSKTCNFCKKIGHTESVCYNKQRVQSKNPSSVTIVPTKEANFLDKRN